MTIPTTRATGVAVLSVLALSVGACGGGNDDSTAAKNISTSIMKSQNGSSTAQFLDLDKKDADCIGKGLVDKIGTDQLKKYGVLDENLKPTKKGISDVKMSPEDAKSTTSVLFGCADVETKMQNAFNKAGQIPKSMRTCINKALSEANLRPMLTQMFQGNRDAAQKALTGPMTKCATGSSG